MIKLNPAYKKRLSELPNSNLKTATHLTPKGTASTDFQNPSHRSRSNTPNHSQSFANLFQDELSQIPLLSKSEEKTLIKSIFLFRQAFQRLILKEHAVADHLVKLLSQWQAKTLRLDSVCNVALSETKKRRTLEPAIVRAIPQLTKLVKKLRSAKNSPTTSEETRQLHREAVNLVEPLSIRPKSFESTPFENQLAHDLLDEYKMLCKQLTNSNLRLVAQTVRQICGSSPAFMDMVQEGTQGLMHAVVKFDHSRNLRFSTYAIPWIRQYVYAALSNYDRNIRIPDSFRNTSNRVFEAAGRAKAELESTQFDSSHLICTISEELKMDPKLVSKHLQFKRRSRSLDQPGSHDGMNSLIECLICPSECPQRIAQRKERAELTQHVLQISLTAKEREVIRLRYGLDDGQSRSFAEVGRLMGVTRERVRQIEKPALEKLKRLKLVSSL